MNITVTAFLGVLFLGLALISTFLMFRYWGYPYDEEKRKSACPQWKMNIHRGVGYGYVLVYIVLMSQMVPRMWTYQIEFPARTVVHICLGITIGVILLLKISILRWFRHFEEWMPYLGVALLLCSFLLVGLSLPFVLKERALAGGGYGGSAFSEESQERVARLLPQAGLPVDAQLDELATRRSLERGRQVLLEKCIYCHDLKTAIARPRTPIDWYRTVRRMADKPTLGPVIGDDEAYQVTAYLIAITPELQGSAVAKRRAEERRSETREAVARVVDETDAGPPAAIDPEIARDAYETVCAQCHGLDETEAAPPRSVEEVDDLIQRMVENGLEETEARLELVKFHMVRTFVD